MNIAPPLLAGGSWHRVWWFGTIASLGALVLFLILYRDPSTGLGLAAVGTEGARHSRTSQNLLLAALSIRDVWLLSISFVVFNILTMAMGTFLPAFLMKQHHLGAPTAGLYSSLGNMVMIISCPLGGFMSDRVKVKKWIIAVGFTLLSTFWLFAFSAPLHFVPALVIVFGIVLGPVLPVSLALLPNIVKRPELMGFGVAILMFTMALGAFIGPVLFGRILDISSWTVASYAMIPVCLIGAVTASKIRCR
jgi:MFS family permease